jgi:hypothetical protein
MPTRHPRTLVSLVVLIATGVIHGCTSHSPAVTLDIPGRSDATPWVAASGSFVAAAWGASADGKTDVFLAVSHDGGRRFGAPVQVNAKAGEARLGGELPPRVAIGPARNGAPPEIVVLWTARGERTTIKTARSRDGGRTFEAPVMLQSPDAVGDRGWPSVAIDRQARVHAVWLDHRGMAAHGNHEAGHAAHKRSTAGDGVDGAQRSALYYAAVSGAASGERRLANGVCYCCKTALAAAPDGSLYATWRHVYPGNLRDMAMTVSRDRGATFSPPVRVSEDRWTIAGCPDDGPAVDVDGDGRAHLVWPTVIGGDEPRGAIFYASTDDGLSFTPRSRIGTLGGLKPSHPQVVVSPAGRIFVAWDETFDGRRVAAFRELRPRRQGEPLLGEITVLSKDPALYPVLAATDTGLVAVWSTGGDPSRVEVRVIQLR